MIKITEQTKVVIKFTNSFLDTVNILLNLEVGDTSRLEHVKRMILEDKPLYTSDQEYVKNLANTHIKDYEIKTDDVAQVKSLVRCRNCSTSIPQLAKYCTLCGTRQNRKYSNQHDIVKLAKKYNPLQIITKPNSYQSLAIIGGLTAIIPVLFIVARMDPLLDSINYETGRDISGLVGIFIFLGIFSSILSAISVAITFLIKNPRKIGRILFFMSFAILITSILIGVVGFVFILIASNVAYKKRHY